MYMYLAPAVCLAGLLMWVFVDPVKYPKVVRIGEIMFTVGLLAALLTWHGGKPFGLIG